MCSRITCVAAVAATAVLLAAAAAQDLGEDGNAAALDEALLEDLGGGGLLEGLDDIPLDPAFDERQEPPEAKDQRLLDELGEGEDIDLGGEDELTRIARQMRLAQRRIAGQEVSRQTQELQEKIVADLDALIQRLQQQQQQSSAASSSAPSPASEQEINQPDQQPDAGQEKPSSKPARDSQERLGQHIPEVLDAAAMEALVKRVWGHLPDRARQQMQHAATEEFLPKYQHVIEEYFRRLAEEQSR